MEEIPPHGGLSHPCDPEFNLKATAPGLIQVCAWGPEREYYDMVVATARERIEGLNVTHGICEPHYRIALKEARQNG